jgi:Na+/H+-dicarboxylate symporter
VFLAVTQGISLTPVDYVIICLLSTLASIGTTPIPSSSLVLTVMIAQSVNVPITGMYAVIVSMDWFLDRMYTFKKALWNTQLMRILRIPHGCQRVG